MQRLDKIIYDALCANEELVMAVGGRIKSTCFEVSPLEQDNTPLPYIIITDTGRSPSQSTKDSGWMPDLWRVSAGIEIGADSPNEVDSLMVAVMRAVADYIETRDGLGEDIPYLNEGFPQTQGIAWDWQKPCYFDVAHYQCDIEDIREDGKD